MQPLTSSCNQDVLLTLKGISHIFLIYRQILGAQRGKMWRSLTLFFCGDFLVVFLDGAGQTEQLDHPAPVPHQRFDVATSHDLRKTTLY